MLCNPATTRLAAAFVTIAAMLTACAESQTGVASGSRAAYTSVAVVPRVNDALLSVYWSSPLASPVASQARLGWSAADGTGQISREILGRAGASVTVTSAPTGSAARAAQAVVVLQQTPLNELAQNYDPGRDLLISAASLAGAASAGGLAVIVINDPAAYQPRSVLRISRVGADAKGDPNLCAIGLTPSLVDPATGKVIQQGRSLMGVEKLPGSLSGRSWSELGGSERATVLAYCQSALRRVVSQSFVELGIVK
ncbi:hypothetical protein LCL97_01335 [Seohaeicola saemankumensis]|nr:hypothetical protein [Seohaeicola saemankumensis]MCA0869455.1 hypothetical protein [Seohaeicola saemankumensis]